MGNVLVRNVPEETHRELKLRAKRNGRSVNDEILAALGELSKPQERIGLGTALQQWKQKHWGDMEDFTFEIERDQTPARYPDFSGPEYDPPESA